MSDASFGLLGPLEVRRRGELVEIPGSIPRQLLSILLLAAGRSVTEERLIDDLWGHLPPATATRTLQAHISRLRTALRAAGIPAQLSRHGGGYALDIDPDDLDLNRFQRRLMRGREAAARGAPDVALAHLEEALAEWRGDPLAEFRLTHWAPYEQHRLQELGMEVRELRAEAQVALGDHAAAMPDLRRLVDQHPLRERLWQLLIVALYRSGRQTQALEAYGAARGHLSGEFGIEPGSGLRSLHIAVLQQDPALELPPSPVSERTEFIMGKLQERKLEHLFRLIDADRDGYVTGSDFEVHANRLAALATTHTPQLAAEARASVIQWWHGMSGGEAVDRVDINGWLEFWSGWLTMVAADAEVGGGEALQQLNSSGDFTLRVIDTDGDGTMSFNEYSAWIEAWGFDIDTEVAFKQMDADGDGVLCHEEAARALREFFLSNDPGAPGNCLYGSPF